MFKSLSQPSYLPVPILQMQRAHYTLLFHHPQTWSSPCSPQGTRAHGGAGGNWGSEKAMNLPQSHRDLGQLQEILGPKPLPELLSFFKKKKKKRTFLKFHLHIKLYRFWSQSDKFWQMQISPQSSYGFEKGLGYFIQNVWSNPALDVALETLLSGFQWELFVETPVFISAENEINHNSHFRAN